MNVRPARRCRTLLLVLATWLGAVPACAEVSPGAAGDSGLARPAVAAPRRPVAASGFQRLTDRAYAFVAADERSANGALFIGDDAALAVDPGLTPELASSFLEGARRLTDKPVRWAVLTHWHPDHALGAVCLDPALRGGTELVCHPATRRALAEHAALARDALVARAAERGDTAEREAFEGSAIHLPGHTVEEREVFELGRHELQVFHPGAAHTQGDLVVWSPDEGVLVTGDVFMAGACPSMGEGSVRVWLEALARLEALHPRHVVPGHFAPGGPDELAHFAGYLALQRDRAAGLLARGSPEPAGGDESAAAFFARTAFADMAQFPQYGATFQGNAAAVLQELRRRPPPSGEARGFTTLAVLDVGAAPQQIAFGAAGERAYVAEAGSDRVTVLSTHPPAVLETRDGADRSLFAVPLPDGRILASSEEANTLSVVDGTGARRQRSYPTGSRPFPPIATADGRLAFVPNYDDGTLSVIDLWNQRVLDTVALGEHPSGGCMIESMHAAAVALRGEDALAFVNTASFAVERRLFEGIGRGPFSVALTPDESLAFVNNTADHDVSVVALDVPAGPRVIARPAVGGTPISLAVHPSGRTLWVGCEGSNTVWVLKIPDDPAGRAAERRAPPAPAANGAPGEVRPTEVLVLGMIHGAHRTSERWGLAQVEATIRAIDPDVICPEIPPERWDAIWSDYAERGVIEDPRVMRFPEYTDVLLPLKVQLGFAVVPCAAWTRPMSDLRAAVMAAFEDDPSLADERAAYEQAEAEVEAALQADPIVEDDPRVIHSEAYDERTRHELQPYDEFLNDRIGPGGWTNINRAHFALIRKAIAEHPGERVLVTFGAGHKGWILQHLRQLQGVKLLDVTPYLP